VQLDAHAEAAIGHAARQIYGAHHGDANFTGCGIGFRRRAGRQTDEPVAVAMVVNKRPEGIVSRRRLLPETVNVAGRDWGVDVVEVGPLSFSAAPADTRTVKPDVSGPITGTYRPPLQGASISNINAGTTGTLGCLVRDSDGTICVLSSNHVLARVSQAKANELIIQPGATDGGSEALGIAALKRSIKLTTGTNTIDAAIAQLTDQNHISQNVAGGLMSPISSGHPAVAMVVADDSGSCSRNCFLTRMDSTINQLGVTMLAGSGSVVAPQVGMHIEKVGRSTGYTSSTIAATGAIVKVTWAPLGEITLSDMIWTQAFHTPGDSGSVACQGGDGRTFAPLPEQCTSGTCALLEALATYYDIPVNSTDDNELADHLRDTFLAESSTGQLIIGAVYLNAQMIIDRLSSQTGSAHNQAQAQARAQALYSQYHDLAKRLIDSASPTDVVTSSDINTAGSILFGLTAPPSTGGTGMTTASESAAAWALFQDILQPCVGMGRQQIVDYMNTSAVFQEVHAKMLSVATLRTSGSVV
jgi:hypothetical protein